MRLPARATFSLSACFGFWLAVAAGPSAAAEAKAVVPSASRAFARVPVGLRPQRLVLVSEPRLDPFEPAIEGVEYHRSGALLVGAGAESVSFEQWLHEIAHVRLAGARPNGKVARRLVDAVEEGVADYFAASIAGTPRLGAAPRQRDLLQPPHIGPSEWASLAFDGFDTHRMGWALAAELYRVEPRGGALLEDAVACLDQDSQLDDTPDSPAATLAALLAACPERSRARLSRVFHTWLPPQLFWSDRT